MYDAVICIPGIPEQSDHWLRRLVKLRIINITEYEQRDASSRKASSKTQNAVSEPTPGTSMIYITFLNEMGVKEEEEEEEEKECFI